MFQVSQNEIPCNSKDIYYKQVKQTSVQRSLTNKRQVALELSEITEGALYMLECLPVKVRPCH